MAIELFTKPEHNLDILVHVGKIQDDEFLDYYRSFFESDTFDPSRNLLVDLREANSSTRSVEILRKFAEFARATLKGLTASTKVAVVAPKDVSFGLARTYEAFTNSVPWDFKVFRAIEDSLAWLDLSENPMLHQKQEFQQ